MQNYLAQCLTIWLLFILSTSQSYAFEEHDAHEHGHATLMLVQEQQKLQLVFKSPAMNIVGFEHQANSHEQQEKIHHAEHTLKDATQLFLISSDAKCILKDVHVTSSLLTKHKAHDDHAEKKQANNNEHNHHSHDEHDDHEKESAHSEFEAEYDFECQNISALKEIKVALFEAFASIEDIDAQVISHSGQKLLELDHNNTSIKL